MSSSRYPVCNAAEPARYGQLTAAGIAANVHHTAPPTVKPTPISALPSSRGIDLAMAFQLACSTADPSTARVTVSEIELGTALGRTAATATTPPLLVVSCARLRSAVTGPGRAAMASIVVDRRAVEGGRR